jgi:hypothetical protein
MTSPGEGLAERIAPCVDDRFRPLMYSQALDPG